MPTQSQVNAQIASLLPDNTSNTITPYALRSALYYITDFLSNYSNITTTNSLTRILSSADATTLIVFTSTGATTVTVPAGLGQGFNCMIVQNGAGKVTLSASGVTINSYGSALGTAGQYAAATLFATSADTFTWAGSIG